MVVQLQAAVAEGRTDAAAAAETELSALGGRASYQAASELTTARHRTSKWIFSILTQMKLRPSKGQPPLKVLEVYPGVLYFSAFPGAICYTTASAATHDMPLAYNAACTLAALCTGRIALTR